jgi:hypothetical protein
MDILVRRKKIDILVRKKKWAPGHVECDFRTTQVPGNLKIDSRESPTLRTDRGDGIPIRGGGGAPKAVEAVPRQSFVNVFVT